MVTQYAFCSKCNAWKGSLGLEPTFDLYIRHLVQIFDQVKRVLRPTGACWVVMGDTYAGMKVGNTNRTNHGSHEKWDLQPARVNTKSFVKEKQDIPDKSLCMIPERFAIEMINRGWILRNKIIWHKPNCMPSSAKDRFTVDYETVFFFVKSQRYYFETQYETQINKESKNVLFGGNKRGETDQRFSSSRTYSGKPWIRNDLGRIKRCVWKISTKPYSGAHFAVFPEQLIETPIKATCPEYVCPKCGVIYYFINKYNDGGLDAKTPCNCLAGVEGGIVLDPFMGAGTTGLIALKLARRFVGIELNPEYIKLAYDRLEPLLGQGRLST